MKSLTEWSKEIHDWANSKQWWSRPTDNIAGKLLLVHSEVSEAAEELRKAAPCPHGAPDVDFDDLRRITYDDRGKMSGFRSELADTLIRVLDIYGRIGADPDADVAEKMAFNQTRQVRHGGLGL